MSLLLAHTSRNAAATALYGCAFGLEETLARAPGTLPRDAQGSLAWLSEEWKGGLFS